ncbi:hypothetical protein [Vibrio parahaemolyticus]|uniref:hypothetical protein n=2 Tax=Vibrio TaxID=662 RepID=UPI0015F558B2|nr:hypothetical protein [Vibrio parahaemolyticus]EJE4166060.1 hypothetical protein [Vibrio parahaemolyticus]MCI9706495.1 hypothetical protein [Vibrio parahaemolyticus]MDF4637839.1 hypothetical protein [Vibrio parahaemolyticus]MDF5032663.1 hypothetical protein [Vibrio parahaemolyticus]MDF5483826.1 hypothetical protein [Vibrio parahaemolyticus]
MNMNQAPSYEELKDSECFWLQLTPVIAGMNETLDGSIEDEPISSFLYYESNISEVEDGFDFPYQEMRINISERSSEAIRSLSGKYPVGFVRFYEDSASVTLMCRSELVSRMVSTLGMVKDNEIEFFLTIPALPSTLPNVYPVLNFQYRVRSSSRKTSA